MGAEIGRREENKKAKREALLTEGLLRVAEVGFEAASIEQIAARAGVARGTFYLYFSDKIALFDALMDQWYEPLLAVLDATMTQLEAAADRDAARQAYESMAFGLAMLGLHHRETLIVAFREMRQPGEAGVRLRQRERHLLDRAVALTEMAQRRRLLDIGDARIATLVVYGAIERIFYEVLNGQDLGDPTAIGAEVLALFSRAMGLPAHD